MSPEIVRSLAPAMVVGLRPAVARFEGLVAALSSNSWTHCEDPGLERRLRRALKGYGRKWP